MLSARTEILDHVVVPKKAHLHRLLSDYVCYYNEDRCHLAKKRLTVRPASNTASIKISTLCFSATS